jgi:hypothetical protein
MSAAAALKKPSSAQYVCGVCLCLNFPLKRQSQTSYEQLSQTAKICHVLRLLPNTYLRECMFVALVSPTTPTALPHAEEHLGTGRVYKIAHLLLVFLPCISYFDDKTDPWCLNAQAPLKSFYEHRFRNPSYHHGYLFLLKTLRSAPMSVDLLSRASLILPFHDQFHKHQLTVSL